MDALAALRRWHDAGGVWRVTGTDRPDAPDGTVTVSLCRCDGGEEVDRLRTADPHAVAYLLAHRTSEELGEESGEGS
jgi:hypothetical protein